ncbi:MAG: secondary thiamine-phosphate synthase enzyme [Chloroflexi bacterium HGW-Chloroflexi-9]|jgi:secondary thiamine-phosphate synthase enzyme|nr:MAG: secondary thiamine-phosphate synthase enzyme [Chloroflexi bacterium HGW-Chloroflexi-9]
MVDSLPRPSVRPIHSAVTPASNFVAYAETLEYHTSHALEFIDITADVQNVVARSGVTMGQLVVMSNHTTAAIVLNEHEPLLLNDMARILSRIAPAGDYYEHNDFSIRTVNMTERECANGHAHCQHLFLGASETMPIHNGAAYIGQWQSLFLVELDHARPRSVFVQALGVATGLGG